LQAKRIQKKRFVTFVGNDWGGAQLLISEGIDGRIGRLVLTSSEAFENSPRHPRASPCQMLIVARPEQPL